MTLYKKKINENVKKINSQIEQPDVPYSIEADSHPHPSSLPIFRELIEPFWTTIENLQNALALFLQMRVSVKAYLFISPSIKRFDIGNNSIVAKPINFA